MKTLLSFILSVGLFSSCHRCNTREVCREYQPTNKAIYLDSSYGLEEISGFATPKEGEILVFYKNGNLSSKGNYKRGVLDGPAYYYYPSGYVEQYRHFKNDKKVGPGTDFYDSMDVVKATMYYNDSGSLIWRKTYSRDGKLIKVEGNSAPSGTIISP